MDAPSEKEEPQDARQDEVGQGGTYAALQELAQGVYLSIVCSEEIPQFDAAALPAATAGTGSDFGSTARPTRDRAVQESYCGMKNPMTSTTTCADPEEETVGRSLILPSPESFTIALFPRVMLATKLMVLVKGGWVRSPGYTCR